ncbi:hypothetical protein [Chromobacterium sp. IIBBL 290-4]|uniref:hypothetical protein n=1 Tax=Chromobacterium sp. IIBBL 290-4 TaxID=2953890 RepID=UPI0020B73765|nr:hypothetical protein [Chromobacterium sp. IIBBL 290-4]UTH75763.1 hypothetical protein NKT35_06595 [Chromobacterium sp. IIBBL 290-4]
MNELNSMELEQISAAGRAPVEAIKRLGAEIGIGVVSGMVWDGIKAAAGAAEGWLNNQNGNYDSSSCANGGYCGGAR